MRKLGKTYITLFGNTIEIDSNTSIENKVSIKAKAVTKVKKELIVPTIFNIDYSKNPGKEHELTCEDSDAIFVADYTEISKELNVSTNTIQRSFIDICESYNQIIIKTNKPKTYLINHNVIFKGKLEDFIRDYNVM